LKKKTEFEVIPLVDIPEKAAPVEEKEPAESSYLAAPFQRGRLIENAPFDLSKKGDK